MARKLLMIDDDAALVDAVGRYMKLKGWDFKGLRSPEGAAEKAASFAPDVILLDIEMPGASGWDVCRALKAAGPVKHIPVIMISGRRMDPKDQALGIEVGADDYITKPFDLPVLMLKIDAILRVTES